MAPPSTSIAVTSDRSLPVTPAPMGFLLAFFLLTFAVAWTCFVPLATSAVSIGTPLGGGLALVGTFAPSMVAAYFLVRMPRVHPLDPSSREHTSGGTS